MGKINITESVLERLITECVSEVISENATSKKNITENNDSEKIVLTEEELAQIIEESALRILNEDKITGTAKALKGVGRGLKPAMQRLGQRFNNFKSSFGKARNYNGQIKKGKEFIVNMQPTNRPVKLAAKVEKDGKAFYKNGKTWMEAKPGSAIEKEIKNYATSNGVGNNTFAMTTTRPVERQIVGKVDPKTGKLMYKNGDNFFEAKPGTEEYRALKQSVRSRQMHMDRAKAIRNGGLRNIGALAGAGAAGYYFGNKWNNGGNNPDGGNATPGNPGPNNPDNGGSNGGNGGYPWDDIEPVFETQPKTQKSVQTNTGSDAGTTTDGETKNTPIDRNSQKSVDMKNAPVVDSATQQKMRSSAYGNPQDTSKMPDIKPAQAVSTINNPRITQMQKNGRSTNAVGNAAIRQQNRYLNQKGTTPTQFNNQQLQNRLNENDGE